MDAFDPFNQTLPMLLADGNTTIDVWLPEFDLLMQGFMISSSIALAAQIGACGMMLLIVLTMTARSRFARTTTMINIAGLSVTIVRCVLLAQYFTSTWTKLYVFWASEYSLVSANDARISMVATFLAVPQFFLVEGTLFIQAYAMIQLWQPMWKWLTLAASGVLVAITLAFKCAVVAIQLQSIVGRVSTTNDTLWVRKTDLSLVTASIGWFCLLFLSRIISHMWQYRSVLPPHKGLSAMDVLVMTNGVLMIIPVIFAALQYAPITHFQMSPFVPTSVVLLMPLGSLIAQRMASPQATSAISKDSLRHTGQPDSRKGMLGSFSQHSAGGHKESMTSARRERADAVDLELERVDDMGC